MSSRDSMLAVSQDRYGSADVLELRTISKPSAGPGQILLDVRAASVNPLDWHYMRAAPFFMRAIAGWRRPKQPVRGVDVSGVVEAVGTGVTQFEPGDEVFGWAGGAFAEYVAAPADQFLKKPNRLSFDEAAAVPVAAFTALHGLRDIGRVQPGDRVLIIGASGGVGTFAVQIAKHLGAEVTAVCSARNAELVSAIGADRVVDYTRQDISTMSDRFDVVFQLAGTTSPRLLRRLIDGEGTVVLSSGMGRFSGIGRILTAMVLSPFVDQRLASFVASENLADLEVLGELLDSGTITPVIDRTYPLSETAAAIRYVEDGHTQGKVVVTP